MGIRSYRRSPVSAFDGHVRATMELRLLLLRALDRLVHADADVAGL